jgi:hypothetical protein
MFVQPLLQWGGKKQIVLHITRPHVCSLMYIAGSVHALFCRLWPAGLYNIFAHYLINGTIFEKKAIEHKMRVLILSTAPFQTFLTLKRTD